MIAFILTILVMPLVLKFIKRLLGLGKKSVDSLFDKIEEKL